MGLINILFLTTHFVPLWHVVQAPGRARTAGNVCGDVKAAVAVLLIAAVAGTMYKVQKKTTFHKPVPKQALCAFKYHFKTRYQIFNNFHPFGFINTLQIVTL